MDPTQTMNTDSRNNNRIAQLVCDVLTTKSHLAERGNRTGRFAMIKWGANQFNHIYVDDQQIVVEVHGASEKPTRWRVPMAALEKNDTSLLSAHNSLLLASAKALLDSVIGDGDERFLIRELQLLLSSEP